MATITLTFNDDTTIELTRPNVRMAQQVVAVSIKQGYFIKDIPGPSIDYYPVSGMKKIEVDA